MKGNLGSSLNGNGNLNGVANLSGDANLNGSGLSSDNLLNLASSGNLDSALTAAAVNNPALFSSSSMGPSALLNTDNNLNGSIGGAAAANLLGNDVPGGNLAGNLAGSANLSANDAATMALLAANSVNLSANAADDFFTNLDRANQANLSSSLNAQNGLLSNFGNNDALGNGALNSNINSGVSGAFQSQMGTVPLG